MKDSSYTFQKGCELWMLETVVSTYWSLINTPLLSVFLRVPFNSSECSKTTIHGWMFVSGSRTPQLGTGTEDSVVVVFDSRLSVVRMVATGGGAIVVAPAVVICETASLVVELTWSGAGVVFNFPAPYLKVNFRIFGVVVDGATVVAFVLSVPFNGVASVNTRRLRYFEGSPSPTAADKVKFRLDSKRKKLSFSSFI